MSLHAKSEPAGPFVVSRDEIPLVRIPTSAATHAGFRAWATSDAFPEVAPA
jgi:hypothetical protein